MRARCQAAPLNRMCNPTSSRAAPSGHPSWSSGQRGQNGSEALQLAVRRLARPAAAGGGSAGPAQRGLGIENLRPDLAIRVEAAHGQLHGAPVGVGVGRPEAREGVHTSGWAAAAWALLIPAPPCPCAQPAPQAAGAWQACFGPQPSAHPAAGSMHHLRFNADGSVHLPAFGRAAPGRGILCSWLQVAGRPPVPPCKQHKGPGARMTAGLTRRPAPGPLWRLAAGGGAGGGRPPAPPCLAAARCSSGPCRVRIAISTACSVVCLTPMQFPCHSPNALACSTQLRTQPRAPAPPPASLLGALW